MLWRDELTASHNGTLDSLPIHLFRQGPGLVGGKYRPEVAKMADEWQDLP